VPCFTGAVGSRTGLDVDTTAAGVGFVAAADAGAAGATAAGAVAAGDGVAGAVAGFANIRTGAWGVAAGAAPRAALGMATTGASSRAGAMTTGTDAGRDSSLDYS